jgi:hypothetical protein
VTSVPVSGTEGYAEAADELVGRYESISFADSHRPVLHLIPTVAGVVRTLAPAPGATLQAWRRWGIVS